MKILAIDFGAKRMGLAVGDTGTRSASPLPPLQHTSEADDLARLSDICAAYEVDEILLGLPLNMNGSEGKIAARVRGFADVLRARLNTPVRFIDERLSSFEAEQVLAPLGYSPKKKKRLLDSVAAWIILKEFLEIE